MKKTIAVIAFIILLGARIGLQHYFTLNTASVDTKTVPTENTEQIDPAQSEPEEKSKYMEALEIGGEWFINNQNNKFLYYEYFPYKKAHSNETHDLRELGTLWSITVLAEFLDDERYNELAEKGFKYFEKTFKYDAENDFYYVNSTPDSIKLGYSAFVILSLIGIEHEAKDEYLEKFANGIIYLQQDDGSLKTFFYSDRDSGADYYPGEALVALMWLYEYTQDQRYLETVKKAFPYYVGYFEENPNTAFVPWHSRAYYKLYQATKDKEVADFMFKMNDYMVEQNEPGENCENYEFPRLGTTAVFMEGMNFAYALAQELDDQKRAQCYGNFVKEGADLIIDLQVDEEDIGKKPFKKEALGGFMGSTNSDSQRVDRNQHAVMALMDALKIGLLK